ncbi:acyclic terpene utilization AtuA family protein [Opitutus sp. ER46]|uniref:acyclic terpene utilization AtuA family protein n=1 Tax=Opitutus sp. ER46 TaxID=2161864 RepID=UPI000D31D6FE|nr:acyclic terpene utilization AtuA family protein [Opitutus sp. ER46]PTX96425.1 DUF1446 domain-containing protein [Opitutus sp. ER46]
MTAPLRIANASAFWGDQPEAAARLLARAPEVDVLTLDYLAEVSLSIMAIQRAKDPQAGFARDFLDVLRSLAPAWTAGSRTRVVTNAGGLDPLACGRAARAVLDAAGLQGLRIAVITGDDVLPALRAEPAAFANLETGASLVGVAARLVTANAYIGAAPIADALRAGADIVIAGRVADPSLTVGPCLAHFGWRAEQYDEIAGATLAGHLIECGTQACGGFSTDWLQLADVTDIGFPIAEVVEDGSCVITKPAGTGGAVTRDTVREQLLYEIGDPGAYLSPDAQVSLLGVTVQEVGADRVRVAGARGRPPPETLKVSATYRDGFKAHGQLTVFGHDAVTKARAAGEALLRRLAARGCLFRETVIECLGAGACMPGIVAPETEVRMVETVLRVSVAADEHEPVERFAREIAPLVTCGPQGTTGYANARPRALPIFGYWPCLIDREAVRPEIHWFDPRSRGVSEASPFRHAAPA